MRYGKRYEHGPLQIVAAPKKTSVPRVAFIVSTKIDKRAAVRNRMKRLLRESVQHRLSTLPPQDFVFIARRPLPDAQEDVDALVAAVFQKL